MTASDRPISEKFKSRFKAEGEYKWKQPEVLFNPAKSPVIERYNCSIKESYTKNVPWTSDVVAYRICKVFVGVSLDYTFKALGVGIDTIGSLISKMLTGSNK